VDDKLSLDEMVCLIKLQERIQTNVQPRIDLSFAEVVAVKKLLAVMGVKADVDDDHELLALVQQAWAGIDRAVNDDG
jgi:hypothetical protein